MRVCVGVFIGFAIEAFKIQHRRLASALACTNTVEKRLISMSKFMRTRLGAHNSYSPSHTQRERERDFFRYSAADVAAGVVVYTQAKLTEIRKRNSACGRILWSKWRRRWR